MASGDLATGLSDIGSAVSDIFGSQAAGTSAASYEEAQAIASQNAQIAAAATNTQEMQQTRQIYQTLGTQKAQVGGAGFAESGSALDLLSSSAEQGAISKALTAEQGAIQVNSYEEQAGLFGGMASAATSSGTAQEIGGILNAAGGAVSLYNAAKSIFGPSTATTATVDAATGAILDAGITTTGAVAAGTDIAAAAGGGDLLASLADIFAFA